MPLSSYLNSQGLTARLSTGMIFNHLIPALRSILMSNASDKIWYVRKGIKKLGPFSNAEMRGLASSGKLVPEDMIWKDGLDGWVKASKLKGVFPVQSQVQEVSPPPIESEPETSNERSDTSSGSILLITTIIGLVGTIVGGGLIISSGQKKIPTEDKSASSKNSEKVEKPVGKSDKSFSLAGVRFGEDLKNIILNPLPEPVKGESFPIRTLVGGKPFLLRDLRTEQTVNYNPKDIKLEPFTLYGKRNINYQTEIISGRSSNRVIGVIIGFVTNSDDKNLRNPKLETYDDHSASYEDWKRILLTIKEKYKEINFEDKEDIYLLDKSQTAINEYWTFESKDNPSIKILLQRNFTRPRGASFTKTIQTASYWITYFDKNLLDEEYKLLNPVVDGL